RVDDAREDVILRRWEVYESSTRSTPAQACPDPLQPPMKPPRQALPVRKIATYGCPSGHRRGF
ncbi:MAG: hypothetical protein AAF479_05855, partial [Pseudomonadota bacterium]